MNEKGLLNNILIYIPENVPEDRLLFDKIKLTFTAASYLLYEMTSNMEYPFSRLQFGNVYIRIPKSWGIEVDALDTVRWQSCSKSNFIISNKLKVNFQRMQGFGCKMSGYYTFVGRDYLMRNDTKVLAEELVNEFVLQRYGIISESSYSDNITDSEEYKGEKTQNISCNSKGDFKTKIKNKVDESNTTKICNYTYTTSFQHYTCKGSSIEDVAQAHPDFQNQVEIIDILQPSFITVKRTGTYVVIILDTSSIALLSYMKVMAIKMIDEFDDVEKFFLIFGSWTSPFFEIVLSNKDEDLESFKSNFDSINSTDTFDLVASFKFAYDVTKASLCHKIFLVLTPGDIEEGKSNFEPIFNLLIKNNIIVNIAYFKTTLRMVLCKITWKTGGFYKFMTVARETPLKVVLNNKRFCDMDIGAIEISKREIVLTTFLNVKVRIIVPFRYHRMQNMKIKLNLTHVQSSQEKNIAMSDLGLGSDDLLGDDVYACDLYYADFPSIGNYELLVYIETKHYTYELAWTNVVVMQSNIQGVADIIPPSRIDHVKCFKKRAKIICSWYTVGNNGVRDRISKYELRIRIINDNKIFLKSVIIDEEPLLKVFSTITVDRVAYSSALGISIRGIDNTGNKGDWSTQVLAKESNNWLTKYKNLNMKEISVNAPSANDIIQSLPSPLNYASRNSIYWKGYLLILLLSVNLK